MKLNNVFLKNSAVLVILLGCIIYTSRCNFTKEETTPSQITTVTIHDTIPGDSFPYIVYRDKPDPDTVYEQKYIPANIDTTAILSDYFASVVYKDTLKNDSSYFIVITDTITQNRIAGRSIYFQNLRPIEISTTYITNKPQPEHFFYMGWQVGGGRNMFTTGPLIAHQGKQSIQTVSYDIINRTLLFGYGINFISK